MKKKVKKKKKLKPIEEVLKNYDKIMKKFEHNGATKEDFEKHLKKTVKPSLK